MGCGTLYNVKDVRYGAVGDGFVNDAPAIQKAIDEAAAANGGIVCLPAGRYRIDSTIVPKKLVSIRGNSRALTVVKPFGAIWAFRASEASHIPYECEFADFTIEGDGPASGGSGTGDNLGGINLERADYVTFRNVRVERFSGDGGYGVALGECFWWVFDRCLFLFTHNVDIELYTQENGCNQTVIRDCEIFGRQMPLCTGLRIRGTQNVLVTGCDFEGDGGSIGVDLQASDGITLIGNYLEHWVGPAIRGGEPGLGGSRRVLVEGNVIHSRGAVAVDLNNTGVPNERWVLHHNRFGDLSPAPTVAIRLGNAVNCITYANDTSNDQAPTQQPQLLDTVPGQLDNRPFVGYVATAPWDPQVLADGAATSTTVTVKGARVGDPAIASLTSLPSGARLLLTAFVEANDQVRCVLMNKNGGGINVGNGTLRAVVLKQLV